MRKIVTFVALAALSFCQMLSAQSITLTEFSTGYSSPVEIVNCGDGRLFIVQQNGYIYISDSLGVKQTTPFLNISSSVQYGGERGLLGLAFHPNYATNGYFFVNYTKTGGNTRVSRFSMDPFNPNTTLAGSEQILFEVTQPYSNHNGGGIKFGPDGYLYIGMGDGGSGGDPQGYAQNLQSKLGKMLRIDVDNGSPYSAPADNPFVSGGGLEDIWAYGLRNPWRFSFDRVTHDLWIGDVGQNAYEEVDFLPAGTAGGTNFGWRCYEANHNYNTSGCSGASNYQAPIFEYSQGGGNGCSMTGGYMYRGGKYQNLYGKYLLADYCAGRFWALTPTGSGTVTSAVVGNFSTYMYTGFGEDQYGELYVTGYTNGKIYRISIADCTPTAAITNGQNVVVCTENNDPFSTPLVAAYNPANSYQWFKDNLIIDGANNPTYLATEPGNYYVVATSNAAACTTNATSPVTTITTATAPVAAIQDWQPTVALCDDGTGASITFSAASIPGYTFQWQRNGANIQDATAAQYTATEAGTYAVVVSNLGNCPTPSQATEVVVVNNPAVVVTGETTSCDNIIKTYTTDNFANATYTWVAVGGTIISGQGTSVITVQWGDAGAGNVNVTRIKE